MIWKLRVEIDQKAVEMPEEYGFGVPSLEVLEDFRRSDRALRIKVQTGTWKLKSSQYISTLVVHEKAEP